MKGNSTVLKEHLWKHRVIIVFTDQDLSKKWKNAKEELNERHLIYYQIDKNNTLITNHKKVINHEFIKSIRSTYAKETQQTTQVILIGKDGKVKKRSSKLELKALYSLIDTMPMRKQEIREKSNNK